LLASCIAYLESVAGGGVGPGVGAGVGVGAGLGVGVGTAEGQEQPVNNNKKHTVVIVNIKPFISDNNNCELIWCQP